MKLISAIALGLAVAAAGQTMAADYNYGYSSKNAAKATKAGGHAGVRAANGMTLYIFDKDEPGKSNCYNDCADSWPPYLASASAKAPGGGISIISRADGTRQFAKDGAPLYFWIGDSKPGDTNGDGIGGVWHVAR